MNHYELIPAYFRFSNELRRGVPANTAEIDADHDAYSLLERIVREGPLEEAWELTKEVLGRAPDDELQQYAITLLEQFVNRRRDETVSLIEYEAEANPRFQWAQGCIYVDSDLSDDAARRLRRASGNMLSISRRRDL